jgi:hypothetical protein
VPFARLLYFDLPPDIGGLAIGWRLASEADDRSIPLALIWRIDAIASGGGGPLTIPPPQGLVIAATLDQVAATVDARRGVQIEALEATVMGAVGDLVGAADADYSDYFNFLVRA